MLFNFSNLKPPSAFKNLFFSTRENLRCLLSRGKRIFEVLTKKEKILFCSFLVLFLVSSVFLSVNFYLGHTKTVPIFGGVYTEGVVGRPRFLNPIFATSDVDRDLTELIFSGLLKYDTNGNIIPDLAKEYTVEEGKIFRFKLKKAFWHDGQKVTAEDIVFTIKTIQDPTVKSPFLVNWLGVKVQKISEEEVVFQLKEPYPRFIENATLKILPSHIFKEIPKEEFPLTHYNFEPVGSGPFKIESLEQEKSGAIKRLELVANKNYFGKKPNISQISFLFFEKNEDLIEAAKKGQIEGLTLISPKDFLSFEGRRFRKYSLSLPRYFALFFNPRNSKFLESKEVRKALNYGTNKKEILEKVLLGQGMIVDSPILPSIFGFKEPEKIYEFNQEKAKEFLEKAGFIEGKKIVKKGLEFKERLEKDSKGPEVEALQECLARDSEIYPEAEITGSFGKKTKEAVIRFQEKYMEEILEPFKLKEGTGIVGESTRKKLNEVCPEEEIVEAGFTLITPAQEFLMETAQILKEQWGELGISLKIEAQETSKLKEHFIKNRDYEALLFGEVLGFIPDLFPFWHSLQKNNPGLNLALYENKKADELLEEARKGDDTVRAGKYEEFQEILLEEAPCVFLYNPDFIYLVNEKVKGIEVEKIADSSKRFSGIENWYVKTRRVLK